MMADLIDREDLLEQFRRKKCYESCGLFDICSVPCSTAKILLMLKMQCQHCADFILMT